MANDNWFKALKLHELWHKRAVSPNTMILGGFPAWRKKGFRKILQVKNELLCLKKLHASSCQTLIALAPQNPCNMIFKEMSREEIDFYVKQHSVVRVRCTPQFDVAGGDGRVGCRPDQLLVCDLQMKQRCGHMMNWQKIKRGIADGDCIKPEIPAGEIWNFVMASEQMHRYDGMTLARFQPPSQCPGCSGICV